MMNLTGTSSDISHRRSIAAAPAYARLVSTCDVVVTDLHANQKITLPPATKVRVLVAGEDKLRGITLSSAIEIEAQDYTSFQFIPG